MGKVPYFILDFLILLAVGQLILQLVVPTLGFYFVGVAILLFLVNFAFVFSYGSKKRYRGKLKVRQPAPKIPPKRLVVPLSSSEKKE